jgi:hypothetical protein
MNRKQEVVVGLAEVGWPPPPPCEWVGLGLLGFVAGVDCDVAGLVLSALGSGDGDGDWLPALSPADGRTICWTPVFSALADWVAVALLPAPVPPGPADAEEG